MTVAQSDVRPNIRPDFWMRLDNAAKIHPAVQNEELTSVFRLSCEEKPFHLPFQLNHEPRFNVLIAKVSLSAIYRKSKENYVTITEFLVAVYLYTLQTIYNGLSNYNKRRARKVFRVQVPVNLRKIYGSKTMRHFSLFVTPEMDLSLGEY